MLGDWHVAGTPHFQGSDRQNDYQWAISVIVETFKRFNSTQEYPVWGFGAAFGGKPHHIFQCGRASRAKGVEGILTGYEFVFQTGLEFQDQIQYNEVIRAAASLAKKSMVSGISSV